MTPTATNNTRVSKAYYDLARFASHFTYGAAYIQLKHNLAKSRSGNLPHFYHVEDVSAWLSELIANLNLKLVYHGTFNAQINYLVVSNHVSWLDAVLFAKTAPFSFIAKEEVKSWPVIGSIGKRFETQFIKRQNKFAVYRSLPQIEEALLSKKSVVAFPEGTTTKGYTTKRFHPMLFESAIRTGTAILPVAIRYTDHNGSHIPEISFVGDDSIIDSIIRMFRYAEIQAHIHFMTPINTENLTRKECALLSRSMINSVL